MDGVLVDLYDTLAWSDWPRLRERMAAAAGIDERELMRAFMRTNRARGLGTFGSAEGDLRAVLLDAGVAVGDDALRALVGVELRALTDGGVHLFDDALPMLRALRRRGVRTAIVSNCDHWTRPVVDALGLPDEVDAVVLSFEVGVLKPDAGIFEAALDRVGVPAGRAAFVDDQAAYLDGAAALGMATFQVVRPASEDPPELGAHRVVEDLLAVERAI